MESENDLFKKFREKVSKDEDAEEVLDEIIKLNSGNLFFGCYDFIMCRLKNEDFIFIDKNTLFHQQRINGSGKISANEASFLRMAQYIQKICLGRNFYGTVHKIRKYTFEDEAYFIKKIYQILHSEKSKERKDRKYSSEVICNLFSILCFFESKNSGLDHIKRLLEIYRSLEKPTPEDMVCAMGALKIRINLNKVADKALIDDCKEIIKIYSKYPDQQDALIFQFFIEAKLKIATYLNSIGDYESAFSNAQSCLQGCFGIYSENFQEIAYIVSQSFYGMFFNGTSNGDIRDLKCALENIQTSLYLFDKKEQEAKSENNFTRDMIILKIRYKTLYGKILNQLHKTEDAIKCFQEIDELLLDTKPIALKNSEEYIEWSKLSEECQQGMQEAENRNIVYYFKNKKEEDVLRTVCNLIKHKKESISLNEIYVKKNIDSLREFCEKNKFLLNPECYQKFMNGLLKQIGQIFITEYEKESDDKVKGKLEEISLSYFQEALKFDPKDNISHNDLGAAFFNVGKFEDAIKSFQAAIELNKNDALPYFNLGNAFYTSGQPENALKWINCGLETYQKDHFFTGYTDISNRKNLIDPSVDFLILKSCCLKDLEKKEDAVKCLDSALLILNKTNNLQVFKYKMAEILIKKADCLPDEQAIVCLDQCLKFEDRQEEIEEIKNKISQYEDALKKKEAQPVSNAQPNQTLNSDIQQFSLNG